MHALFHKQHKRPFRHLTGCLIMAATLVFASGPQKAAAQLPYHKWAGGFIPAASSTCTPRSTAVDAAGNVYVTGIFTGTVDFNPAGGNSLSASGSNSDAFVCKLDNTGAYVWAVKLGGSGTDAGYGIAVDNVGNVYTTGYFNSATAYFDPASTSTHTLGTTGGNDIYVSKLNSSGAYVWAVKMGGTGTDQGWSIAVDANSNVYTTGFFNGSAYFDPASTSSHALTSAGGNDIFISKLDAGGNYAWAAKIGGSSGDQGYAIAVDNSGNVYTAGSFFGTGVYFDPNSTSTHMLSATGSSDIFISKLDASGNYLWAGAMGGGSADAAFGIAVDGAGNMYTTGYFSGSGAYFDPNSTSSNTLSSAGSNDIFVSKLDASGNYVWASGMGGSGSDQGYSLAVDGSGSVYTTGYFNVAGGDFDPSGSSTAMLSSAGGNEIFMSKLNAAGAYGWAVSAGATGTDQGYSIATDGLGNLYTTGTFNGTPNFNPNGTSTLTSSNGTGGYILRWAECNSMSTAASNASITTSPMFISGSNQAISFRSNCDEIARLTPSDTQPVSGSVTSQVVIDGSVQNIGGNKYVQRHYDIHPALNPNTATAIVTLYFTQAEFDAYNTAVGLGAPQLPTGTADAAGKANVRVTQYHGTPTGGYAPGNYPATWGGTGPVRVAIDPLDANVVWNAAASRWEVSFNVTGFSGFFVYAGNDLTPLPIGLLSFGADLTANKEVLLSWKVANAADAKEYRVERSADGQSFYAIGTVAASNVAEYRLHDNTPLDGKNYYRLHIIETNGSNSYSGVEMIYLGTKQMVQVIPSPAHDHITIVTNAPATSATLSDMQGKVRQSLTVKNGTRVDISTLPAGVYLLKLSSSGEVIKVVKE